MQYAIVVEKGKRNYSAYMPDLPGCVATGATAEEVTQLIREGIALLIEDMIANGQEIPAPSN
jgi:predicted RNase H-like HicB family nuclease